MIRPQTGPIPKELHYFMRWVIIQVIFSVQGGNAMKAKVYFSREITPEKVVALYRAVGRELPGKVAVKLHSGEQGNQNFWAPTSGGR